MARKSTTCYLKEDAIWALFVMVIAVALVLPANLLQSAARQSYIKDWNPGSGAAGSLPCVVPPN